MELDDVDKQLHLSRIVHTCTVSGEMPRLEIGVDVTVTRRGDGDMFIGSGVPSAGCEILARERRESGMNQSRRRASLFAVARSNPNKANLQ